MAITIREPRGENINFIKAVLEPYDREHPDARIDMHRQNSISFRIRVTDPFFGGVGKVERHERIWKYPETLPEEVQGDISMVALLAPGEEARSMANLEFEDPSPSLID